MCKISRKKNITLQDVNGDSSLLQFCELGEVHIYGPRQVFITEGAPANSLFLLVEGNVQVFTTDKEGHELVLSYISGLNIIGEMGFFEHEPRRSASMRARTEIKIVEMSYDKFRELCYKNPGLLFSLAKHLADRLKFTSQQMSSMAFDDVQDRVIETIFYLAKLPDAVKTADGIQIRTTRQEIGNILGCSRETVGRVIKELEERNVLDSQGKTILVKLNNLKSKPKENLSEADSEEMLYTAVE